MGRVRGVERGLFLITAIALALPTTQPANTAFILESLIKNRADCSTNISASTPGYLFDGAFMPAAGVIRNPDGTIEPSAEGKTRLEAVAFAVSTKRLAPMIFLLGESKGESVDREYLRQIAPDIPDEVIQEEDGSVNTTTNMEGGAKIAQEKGMKRFAIVTSASHLLRATVLACTHGLAAAPFSAEQLLIEKDPQRAPALDKMNSSLRKFFTRIKETLEVLWMLEDPKGDSLTWLRKTF